MRVDRSVVLLSLGAGAGLLLAAAGLLRGAVRGRDVPRDAVARVNGEPVGRETYERVLSGMTKDRRAPLDAAERRRVLDRLIDEELLVQRGMALGLVRRDTRVRKDLTSAMIDAVVADEAAGEPSDAEIARLYAARPDLSTRPGLLHVRRIWCRVARPEDEHAGEVRATRAAAQLAAGVAFDAVRAALGDEEIAAVPAALLPTAKLLDYLGPTAVRAAEALATGATSGPLRTSGGYQVLQLVERRDGERASLPEVRETLVAELRRQHGEQALRRYLEELRRGADIELARAVP